MRWWKRLDGHERQLVELALEEAKRTEARSVAKASSEAKAAGFAEGVNKTTADMREFGAWVERDRDCAITWIGPRPKKERFLVRAMSAAPNLADVLESLDFPIHQEICDVWFRAVPMAFNAPNGSRFRWFNLEPVGHTKDVRPFFVRKFTELCLEASSEAKKTIAELAPRFGVNPHLTWIPWRFEDRFRELAREANRASGFEPEEESVQ